MLNQIQVSSRWTKYAWIIFVSICVFHCFTLRPLWIDEQYVFDSIESYNYAQIFGPLKTHQAFPRVHLVIVKAFSDFFDHHLLSLRFFSLVFMLLAFFVWIKNYRQMIQAPTLFILSVFSFAASFRMAYYGAELKPYSMDVLSVGLFVWFLYYQSKFIDQKPSPKFLALSALMPLLFFFSYATIFVFWMIAFNFCLMAFRNKSLIKPLVINILSSVVCLLILYHIDLKHFMHVGGYYNYWKNYFIGHQSLSAFFTPFGEGYIEVGTWWFGESRLCKKLGMIFLPFLFYALVRYGWGSLKKNGFKLFTLENIFGVLFLELVVLSMFGRYPFSGDRITLFLAPFVFYMILRAIEDCKKIRWAYWFLKSYYVFYLVTCFVVSILWFYQKYQ